MHRAMDCEGPHNAKCFPTMIRVLRLKRHLNCAAHHREVSSLQVGHGLTGLKLRVLTIEREIVRGGEHVARVYEDS